MTVAGRLARLAAAGCLLAVTGVRAQEPQAPPAGAPAPAAPFPKLSSLRQCSVSFGASRPLGEKVQEYTGYVDLDCGAFRIQADRVVHDGEANSVRAEGNVSLAWEGNRLAGRTLDFDLDSETGTIEDAMAILPPDAIVTAERMEKVSEDTVLVHHAVFTSCTQPVPYWSFRVRNGRFHLDHYAWLHGVTMRASHVPVFHTPWLVWPIKGDRATGLLVPHWGTSNYSGFFIGDQFFWPMTDSADLTLQADWHEKSGTGGGIGFNWLPSARGKVALDAYGLNDRQKGDFRYVASLRASQPLGEGWKMGADLNDVSDFRYYGDFSQTLVVSATPATVSRARIGRDWSYYSFAARLDDRTQYFLSESDGTRTLLEQIVQRSLPEVELRGGSRRLWPGAPVYFSFQTRGNAIDRRDESFLSDIDADGEEGGRFSATYGRADADGRFSLPVTPAPWLDLELVAELRQTWWGAGQVPFSRDPGDGTLATGIRESDALSRSFGQLSLEATGPKAFRVWGGEGGRVKHVIEPRVLWQLSPQSDYRDEVLDPGTGQTVLATPIPFDEIEAQGNAFRRLHQVTFGIRQRLLARRPPAPIVPTQPRRQEPGVAAPPWGPGSLAPEPAAPAPPVPPEVYPAPGAAVSGEVSSVAEGTTSVPAGEEPLASSAEAAEEADAGALTPGARWPWPAEAPAVVSGRPTASAARAGAGGNPVEIASLEISESWSLEDPLSVVPSETTFDSATGKWVTTPAQTSNRGPIQILGRVNPSLNFSIDLRADYDVLANRFSTESLSASFRGAVGYSNLSWVRRVPSGPIAAKGSAVTASGGVVLIDRKLSLDLGFAWDGTLSRFVDQAARVGYYTQCCGFLTEWGRRDFLGNERDEIRFLLDLKGIGKFLDLRTATGP